MRALVFVFVAVLAFTASNTVIAETRALLIGVSGYPSLPENRRLRGPANDVQLMREALLRAGVPASGVRVLADGVHGSSDLPTHQAILAGMRTLADQAQPKDWVIVYFSGHGSQQPQLPEKHTYLEPDGLDEIFLPYDIGQWDGSKMAVRGALVDDEIAVALQAITDKGARIWAIFDTCHAGGMSKGRVVTAGNEGGPVTRFVSPSVLGVPQSALSHKRSGRSKRRGALQTPDLLESGSQVFFYAAQPDEPAAEEPLPDLLLPPHTIQKGAPIPNRYFGLFTYLIAQALPNWHGSFGVLASHVGERYKVRPYPTPLFEGDLGHVPEFFVKSKPVAKNTSIKP